MLGTGLAWLEDQRNSHMTVSVTYSRGVNSVTLTATRGKSDFEEVDEFGVVQRMQSRDYLVLVADLILSGVGVIPAVGDRITDAGATYEVLSISGQPHWRYSDVGRLTFRIHTKQVS